MERTAKINRVTKETSVDLSLNLDCPSKTAIETNIPLLTHFISALALHGRIGMTLSATGDVDVDAHHLVEDVGITLGMALNQALGDNRGIARFGQRLLPMDDALVLCALDISGRGQCYWWGAFPTHAIGTIGAEVWPEFFHGLARSAGVTLHMRHLAGTNAHHVYEASFKGLGQALKEAVRKTGDELPSTKGML